MKKIIAALACLVALIVTAPLTASGQVLGSLTTAQLEWLLKSEGFTYTVDKGGDIVWKIDGFRTRLVRTKSDGVENACLQFHAVFENDGDATSKKINLWNKTKRYSRTYLDDDGDPVLELDLDMSGGVTKERVASFLKTCRLSFTAWRREVLN